MRRMAILALLASASGVAHASDKPLYQPAPDWVRPAPPIDATKLKDDSPLLLTLDRQERLQDGTVWSYSDIATRLATPEVVTQAGTITVPWQPSKGDLIIHKLEIIRGPEHIDLLAAGKRFEVLRREQQLEQFQVNGMLTATMAVEGLRVGDVLHFVASTTVNEPALHGEMQGDAVLPAGQANLGFVRARLLWPSKDDIHWRSYAEGGKPAETTSGGYHEITLTGGLPKPAELPSDAPLRFRKPPLIEASTFADWAAVSKVTAPLYATEGVIKPGGALAGEVSRIAAAEADPLKRAAAALQLVQEKVRYLYNGLDTGNYVPQSPEQTWALRYGDCKAKTLLLLSILHGLGIEAEPVLANSTLGDFLPERLPSAGAFDHVFVRATIGGESFWLDGTGSGARYSDIRDTPPFHWVLPIRAAGSGLLAVPARAPAHPSVSVALDLDQSAGIRLPTLVHAVVTMRGPGAAMVGLAKSQGTKDQKDQMIGGVLGKLVGGEVALSGYTISYDPTEAIATMDANGIVSTQWERSDGRYRLLLDKTVSDISFDPDRARPAWNDIPVATGAPDAVAFKTRVHLPVDVTGFTLDGDVKLADTLGGTTVHRTAAIDKGWINVDEQSSSTGAEIAPADIPAARARVALAKQRLFKAVAPADLPPRWVEAERGKRDGRFKAILDAYAKAIAADPQSSGGYVNRANFLMGVFDWRAALPDLDRAIELEPTAPVYLQRANLYRVIGDDPRAIADAQAARKLDPASAGAIALLGEYDVDHGKRDEALAMVQERIDAGGENKTDMVTIKADLLTRAGDAPAAIGALDQAIAAKPGNPDLLNNRCWDKALLNTALDTALKDCTKSIELSDSALAALDSRALVYFRMNRFDDALADIGAVLEVEPNMASSLFLRGVIRGRKGDAAGARADIAAAQTMAPLLAVERKHYGIAP